MDGGRVDQRLLRRGVALLWLSVRTHPCPFSLAVAGAVLYSAMAVGGTIVLGRVTDEVILPAFDGGVDRSDVLARRSGDRGRRRAADGWRGSAALFGNMAQRRMQRTWFTEVTDRYLAVPLDWLRTALPASCSPMPMPTPSGPRW